MYLLFYQEVDLGLAADVGTLQRLPKITGNESFVKDICYTARKVYSQEALQIGLVRYSMLFLIRDVRGVLLQLHM